MGSILKKGLFLVTFSGAVATFPATAQAADAEYILPSVGIEEVLKSCYTAEKDIQVEDYLVPTKKGEYLDMAFANVDSFLYIRSEPTKENIIIGNNAEQKAQEIVEEKQEEFVYAESREAEEERLAKEAEEKAKEAEAKAGTGQAIVDYACQFIGNPYVWGGTSLTNGADCSGFVQSVFKNFGINLPRTSGEMRSSGTAVNYSDAMPGDIVCYDGHVGIYMGNGQIVNAINSRKGIGILSATYDDIITVRRLL